MKTKNKILLVVVLTILIMLMGIMMIRSNILTNSMAEVRCIAVKIDPNPSPQRVIVIKSKEERNQIYRLIKRTNNIKVKPFPNHNQSIQCDSKFIIEITYKNGHKDIIQSREYPPIIYRLLKTEGPSGDYGYYSGVNQELYNYINSLNSKQEKS